MERERIGTGVNTLKGVCWSDLSIYCLITLTCFSSESPLDNVTHSLTEWGGDGGRGGVLYPRYGCGLTIQMFGVQEWPLYHHDT